MKLLRWLPIAVAAVGMTATAAADYSSPDEFNERDFESVLNYIKCKRSIPMMEKACDLRISGDIRFEWENIKEKRNGKRMRGKGALTNPGWYNGVRIPNNEFDVEFNLMLDYVGNCTWAVAHLEFDNNGGIARNPRNCLGYPVANGKAAVDFVNGDPEGCQGSGTRNQLCVRKAFFGWNVYEECNARLDIEVGRRNLYDVFDSRVMFQSCFDGFLLRYTNCFECIGDFYVNLGGFVVDENSNHFGWAVEFGLLDIADYGFDFKYSFIDWSKSGKNRCGVEDPYWMGYNVSQFYFAYNLNPELLCSRSKIYLAFLFNHDADSRTYTSNPYKPPASPTVAAASREWTLDKNNFGWYIGFLVGDVCKEGDWSFDINYQYVEQNVFPECDLSGIGKGNVRGIPASINPAYGWLNYQGVRMEMLYALTDNLVLHPSWEYSENIDGVISNGRNGVDATGVDIQPGSAEVGQGVDSQYSKFELEVIYAF